MKTKQFFLAATIIAGLFTQQVSAKIWRVNNNATGIYGENLGGTLTYPVYKQLNEVNSANIVMPGDTIHLEGSNIIYESATITKRLVIIGTGYLLQENQKTSATGLQSKISSIYFSSNGAATSEYSQLIGVYVGASTFGTNVDVSNIVLKRCRFDDQISLASGITDVTIIQNLFSDTANTASIISTTTFGFPTHVIINNNIIERTLILPNNSGYTVDECKNNVFAGPAGSPAIQMYVGYFQNNILIDQNATVILNGISGQSSNPNISHNISSFASSQFGTAYNNIEANMANVFADLSLNSDAAYLLKPNLPANYKGSDGTDRGAFGGEAVTNHYTLSGLAPIPVIYSVATSGVGTPSGLQVTIQARTIK